MTIKEERASEQELEVRRKKRVKARAKLAALRKRRQSDPACALDFGEDETTAILDVALDEMQDTYEKGGEAVSKSQRAVSREIHELEEELRKSLNGKNGAEP